MKFNPCFLIHQNGEEQVNPFFSILNLPLFSVCLMKAKNKPVAKEIGRKYIYFPYLQFQEKNFKNNMIMFLGKSCIIQSKISQKNKKEPFSHVDKMRLSFTIGSVTL